MKVPTADDLMRWQRFLGTPDCPCPTEWKSLGVLYGVNCGKGWVRTGTDPDCPHHGVNAPPPQDVT